MQKSLLICQGNSVAQGLWFTNWILNSISSDSPAQPEHANPSAGCQVVESSILPGGGFLIIVEGPAGNLQRLHDLATKEGVLASMHALLIETVHAQTLPAFYSLQNTIGAKEALLICECKNVLDAFVTANEAGLFSASITILDIRNGRGTSGVPLVILSGEHAALAEWDTEMNKRRMGTLDQRAFIEKPNAKFFELFV